MQEKLAKLMLRVRVFLEGMFLWCGGVVLGLVLADQAESRSRQGGADAAIWIIVLLDAAAVIWSLVARRKDLGDRIRTWEYVLLNIFPLVLTGWYVLAWLHSMD